MVAKALIPLIVITALIVISCSEDDSIGDEGSLTALDTVNVSISKDSTCIVALIVKATVTITSKKTGIPVSGFSVNIESKAYYRTACGSPGSPDLADYANGSGTTNASGKVTIDLIFAPSSYEGGIYKYKHVDYVRVKP
ncbi:hypothetical protein L6Q79_10365 [bacterium]|nr:hypothetical protein [bacterium]NUN45935.1 hypothetical protein [bacterium]